VHTSGQPTGGREENLLGALALAVVARFDTSSEAAALVALQQYLGGRPIEALRRALGLSHPATVRLVDRLAGRGLVRRTAGEDRRSVALALTPAGDAEATALLDARRTAIADVLDPLDDAARDALVPLLERLLHGLAADRATARHLCRLCDNGACGHHDGRCPVTNGARAHAPQDYV
jgi:DNA-binding MarR family transcriptional regulator